MLLAKKKAKEGSKSDFDSRLKPQIYCFSTGGGIGLRTTSALSPPPNRIKLTPAVGAARTGVCGIYKSVAYSIIDISSLASYNCFEENFKESL